MRPARTAAAILVGALLIVSAASASSSSSSWSNKGPVWTKKQARPALLDARRVYALNVPGFSKRPYVFKVTAITAMRVNGPSAKVKGVPAWHRFEVRAHLNPLVEVPQDPDNPKVKLQYREPSFCLHAGKPWRLTGFDTLTHPNYTPYGCSDSSEARFQRGGPYE